MKNHPVLIDPRPGVYEDQQGNFTQVLCVATDEDSGEPVVVFSTQTGGKQCCSLGAWFKIVDGKPRFRGWPMPDTRVVARALCR